MQTIDLTQDEQVLFEDDDNSGVYECGSDEGEYLVLGNLKIKMTEEQLARVRFYFQNT